MSEQVLVCGKSEIFSIITKVCGSLCMRLWSHVACAQEYRLLLDSSCVFVTAALQRQKYAPLSLRPLTCEVKSGHSSMFSTSLSCYECFVDVNDSLRLCWGYFYTEYGVRNVDTCFRTLGRIFTNNEDVIEAGRVGNGYDKQLKEILDAEILPIAEEFDNQLNNDTVYEERLQTAADNFIAAASKLPRVLCNQVSRVQVQSTTVLPASMIPVNSPWTAQVKTQQVDQFTEVTAGLDWVYSIPSTSLQHQGTYQCEIYSNQRSIVRLYYYLTGLCICQQCLSEQVILNNMQKEKKTS
ncbi:hypothetical protein EXN66_Car007448 [Channa argus]|uniref:Uncharacterized protein n=1 Tax=Channa argus TaxID=215402 RepID=A0A6G1PNM1_CHAAH|nr:hypothetical protein EXN66_Car007448 [Channa argus]